MDVYISMTWEDLKTYIGKDTDEEDAFIELCWDRAVLLLTAATAHPFRPIPPVEFDGWAVEVGNELYNRKAAPSGGTMYATFGDGSSIPMRGPRDPLTQVRPLIAMYVVPF